VAVSWPRDDKSIDDFEVVRIKSSQYYPWSIISEIHVCTLKKDTWEREFQEFISGLPLQTSGVFLNGALHWREASGCNSIAFNLAQERPRRKMVALRCWLRVIYGR